MSASIATLIDLISTALKRNELIKLTLGNKRVKSAPLKNLFVKPVLLKSGLKLSFVYRYPTNDITKNFDVETALSEIAVLLQTEFFNADCFTASGDHHLLQQANGKLTIVGRPPALSAGKDIHHHDRQKTRVIKPESNSYLYALGITTQEGLVKKDMQDKYKQINRYVEIVEGILKDVAFPDGINVVDMGCGKGYLTFALYDYLNNSLKQNAKIIGIEIRPDLINLCNQIAKAANFSQLCFKEGSIAGSSVAGTNVLIALHACDTATDDAIYKGIEAGAAVIICAPCCHKQIRREMKPINVLRYVTKHGILLERQAEMLTDSIRAMLMEANGYKTKVFDFIATEHTPKNVMIAGVKTSISQARKEELLTAVADLKAMFGIKTHYLETLLKA